MEIKSMTTWIVGLAVAVVLVAGLMVPVISSLGESGGGSETHITENNTESYYLRVTDATQISLYVTSDGMSYTESPTPENIWTRGDAYQLVLGDTFYIATDKVYDYASGTSYSYTSPLIISGTTVEVTKSDNSTVTLDGVMLITAPQDQADYVAVTNDDGTPATNPYVGDSFVAVTVDDWSSSPEWVLIGSGSGETFDYVNYINWSTPATTVYSGTFDKEDGYLTGITATYLDTTNTYSVTGSEDDYEIYYFVPLEVTGSGSGSEIPGTLMTMISVIPLITVIGIVLGTIGYFRIKQ